MNAYSNILIVYWIGNFCTKADTTVIQMFAKCFVILIVLRKKENVVFGGFWLILMAY